MVQLEVSLEVTVVSRGDSGPRTASQGYENSGANLGVAPE
jgi:hypothetical protein